MIMIANKNVIDISESLNNLIVIGEDFDINGYRVYQLDWWSISENNRKKILKNLSIKMDTDINDYINWYDVKLLRKFETFEFFIIIADFQLHTSNLDQIIKNKTLPIWEVIDF